MNEGNKAVSWQRRWKGHDVWFNISESTYKETLSGKWTEKYDVRQLYAAPVAAAPVDGLHLAVLGRTHFGNPIPQEWYAAARELLASTPAAPGIDLDDVRALLRYGCAGEACTDDEIQNQRHYDAAAERLYSILIDGKIDASPKGGSDSARLDALEELVDDSGGALLLHHGCDNGRGFNGLGLRNTGRTLRQAIDQATSAEVGA